MSGCFNIRKWSCIVDWLTEFIYYSAKTPIESVIWSMCICGRRMGFSGGPSLNTKE